MPDQSNLDLKYFIDADIYNCPFCNRRHVAYTNRGYEVFDWSTDKQCAIWRVECNSCKKVSMHMTFEDVRQPNRNLVLNEFKKGIDIDEAFFYSVPTSFFVIDKRIPTVLRELITEAEGCLKMNYTTGASACTRKAIYELLVKEGAEGDHYDDRIRDLQTKQPDVDPELFEVLAHIKDLTSDKVHEQSWDKWDPGSLKLILETLKTVLHEIYIVPDEKETRKTRIRDLKANLRGATISPGLAEQAKPTVPTSD